MSELNLGIKGNCRSPTGFHSSWKGTGAILGPILDVHWLSEGEHAKIRDHFVHAQKELVPLLGPVLHLLPRRVGVHGLNCLIRVCFYVARV